MITKVEGFILSTVNYGESSLIINLFTKKYGIIGLIAKGVKSMKNKLHALTSKYTYGFFYIYLKEEKLSILKDVDIIDPFLHIRSDLLTISCLAYLSDLTNQVFKECNDENIYDLFITTIKQMDKCIDPMVLTNILEIKYLSFLGVGLVVDECIKCGSTKNIVTIDSSNGGLICQNCYHNEIIVEPKTIKLLRMYYYVDIKSITKINIQDKNKKEIDYFLMDYYNRYTGMYLKSKSFLDKIKDSQYTN